MRKKLVMAAGYGAGIALCWLLLGFGSIRPFSLLTIGGDNLSTLNFAKNYINGSGFRINPSLGFPGVQDNAYFVSFDFSYRAFMRAVALFTNDVGTVYYLLYVAGIAAMFASAAFALRSLRFGHLLSIGGAVVYVVSPWLVFRSFNHDFLALYFSVPLGAALALRVALEPKASLWHLTGAVVPLAVIATSGLYYAYFSLMFIILAAAAAFPTRGRNPLIMAAVAVAVVVPLLLVTGFGSALLDLASLPIIKRHAGQQLVYGLNFAEATTLFNHVGPLRWVHEEYRSFWPYLSLPHDLDDWPGFALTGIIFASPLAVAAAGFDQGPRSYRRSLVFLSAACIVFGIVYAMDGGLGYYVGLFVNPLIRATDRIIPFLAFFALVIALAAVEALIARRSMIIARAIVAALLVSMIPSFYGLANRSAAIISSSAENVGSIRKLLAAKDKADIKAILQIPHAEWPETAPVRGFDMRSLQKYFILDRPRSGTRWSYGGSATQPAFLAVSGIIRDQSRDLASAARGMEFDGVVIDKFPLDEAEQHGFQARLNERVCKVYEDALRVLYALRACP
ncbi:hypothetical protein JQ543_21290 [Bradyrhizobium diazoefficiens]|nr:hypothetical protein [Bradyrhizobium diazoefficiens]MBR0850293.1 hypothetical protein [Bradyrhizobium diazoefficiens]